MSILTPFTAVIWLLSTRLANAQSAAPTITTAPAFGGGELGVLQEMFDGITDTSLSNFCVSSAFSAFLSFSATPTTVIETIVGVQNITTMSSVFTSTFTAGFNPVFSTPCCSSCTIQANNVQLFFWPTPAPTGFNRTTAVNSAGFTFTSPSIYLAFPALSAFDLCSTGSTLISQTVALPPNGLFSFSGSGDVGMTQTAVVNFADFNGCSTTSFNDVTQASDFFRCSPMLVLPTQVEALNPAFSSCVPQLMGVFDPPSVLTPVPTLAPNPPQTQAPTAAPNPQPVMTLPPASPPASSPPAASPPAASPPAASPPASSPPAASPPAASPPASSPPAASHSLIASSPASPGSPPATFPLSLQSSPLPPPAPVAPPSLPSILAGIIASIALGGDVPSLSPALPDPAPPLATTDLGSTPPDLAASGGMSNTNPGGAQVSIVPSNAGDAQSGITNTGPEAATPISTAAIVSVVTSASSTFATTVGSTTIFSPASGSSSGAGSVSSDSPNVSINSSASVAGISHPILTSGVSLGPANSHLSLASWAVMVIMMLLAHRFF